VNLKILLFVLLSNIILNLQDDTVSYLFQVVKATVAPKMMILGQLFFFFAEAGK